MKTSVVILNYKTYSKTISCIESLISINDHIDRIIIIDNNSENESLKHISEYLSDCQLEWKYYNSITDDSTTFILHQNIHNSGYAKGNNIGIGIACAYSSDFILIMNNDIVVNKNAVNHLIDFYKSQKGVGCLGPLVKEGSGYDINFARKRLQWYDHFLLSGIMKKILPAKLFLRHHFISYQGIPNHAFEVDTISGSAMLFHSDVLRKIEGFDENTFLYYEEAIITEKLREHNLKTWVVPQSTMIHEHAGSTKMVASSKILKHSLNSQYYYLNSIRKYNPILSHTLMIGQYLTFLLIKIRGLF